MDDDYKRDMQQSAAALGHVAMSLQHFSMLLIRIGLDAGVLTPDTLERLRDETIRGLKNSQTVGVSMEMDADAIGQALGMLGPMLDAAIDDAQARDEGTHHPRSRRRRVHPRERRRRRGAVAEGRGLIAPSDLVGFALPAAIAATQALCVINRPVP